MDLLPNIPVVNFFDEVVDNTYHDLSESVNKLYNEVKRIDKASMKCSLAAYRSRIVQVTYIYNSIVKLINTSKESEDVIKKAEHIADVIHDKINAMWDAYNEW